MKQNGQIGPLQLLCIFGPEHRSVDVSALGTSDEDIVIVSGHVDAQQAPPPSLFDKGWGPLMVSCRARGCKQTRTCHVCVYIYIYIYMYVCKDMRKYVYVRFVYTWACIHRCVTVWLALTYIHYICTPKLLRTTLLMAKLMSACVQSGMSTLVFLCHLHGLWPAPSAQRPRPLLTSRQ